ncbi:glutaredoxin family protein [Candidatus Gracilibacteria bacterium]|nr:glutaredoxin family protein [Candidatus Gracilibacteria bacterium]
MKIFLAGWMVLGIALFTFFPISNTVTANVDVPNNEPTSLTETSQSPNIYVFGRDECGFCKALFTYLTEEEIPFTYLNIVTDEHAKSLYDQVTEKHNISKVTPVTVIGEKVIVGFNGGNTTGLRIKQAWEEAQSSDIKTVEDHIAFAPVQSVASGGGCTDISCDSGSSEFVFELPFFGIVDLQSFSLATLSIVLGIIDGFNPCAMWVLVTFLVLLSQAGSKKKMVFLAGLFIFAEAIMYNMILNVWYKTWDFVALDQIVTPIVGLIGMGGGLFFLWRWHKNKSAELICDITDLETQGKTINRFKRVIEQPITVASVFAIIVIALSVNIIEFACSIGIPQAYTKILELNGLEFVERQWYILIYTFGYMIDDFIVFGLAIWGYSRLQSHGGRYGQLSLLIGGILMLILGALLIFYPEMLVL